MTTRWQSRPRAVLLLGGTSEIGSAAVRALELPPTSLLILAGRDPDALSLAAKTFPDWITVRTDTFDALQPDSVAAVIQRAFDQATIDVVIPAFGVLGHQTKFEQDPATTKDVFTINITTQARALLEAATRMRQQGSGTLVVLSSIAAVRPRRANFVYGASKAALDAFARGLSDSLHATGVRVVIVRPGFVVGRMTEGMTAAPLSTTPDVVGRAIAAAVRDGRSTVWVPPALRTLALLMRLTPSRAWRRLRR